MDDKQLAAVAGVRVQGGYEPDVWDMLDRHPDKYDKKTQTVIEEGRPRPTLSNLWHVLTYDSRLRGRLRFNQFSTRIEYDKELIADHHEAQLAIWLEQNYRLIVTTGKVHEVIESVSRSFGYHPVRDYLRALHWDGQSRLDTWLAVYLGAVNDELNAEIGKRFLLSCVARVMQPGCKVDTVLVVAGKQGIKKSTALRTLCGAQWFCDTALDIGRPDAMAALQGQWIYEWAELDSVKRRDATTTKAFLSSQVDRYRPSYGRNHIEQPRQVVFVGTTNERTFLKDSTGERRYWPVQATEIDLEALEEDRDQLWAEAMAYYRSEPRWWLSDEYEAMLIEAQEAYKDSDPWADTLAAWIDNRPRGQAFTLLQVMEEGLELPIREHHRHHQARVRGILDELGAEACRFRDGGRYTRGWRVPDSE